MVELVARWAFVLSTVVLFGFGAILTTISLFAYIRSGRLSVFRTSTVGFALVTAGSLTEPMYQFILSDTRFIGQELYVLQAVEGLLVGAGLGLLFYSIYRYNGANAVEPEL